MKARIKNQDVFHPEIIEITIESADELKYLWCAINVCYSYLQKDDNTNKVGGFNCDVDRTPLFHALDLLVKTHGLKK